VTALLDVNVLVAKTVFSCRLTTLAALLLALSTTASAQGTNPCAPDEGLVLKTLRILGVAASPGQIKGDDDAPAGDLYLTSVDGQGSQLRLTEGGVVFVRTEVP